MHHVSDTIPFTGFLFEGVRLGILQVLKINHLKSVSISELTSILKKLRFSKVSSFDTTKMPMWQCQSNFKPGSSCNEANIETHNSTTRCVNDDLQDSATANELCNRDWTTQLRSFAVALFDRDCVVRSRLRRSFAVALFARGCQPWPFKTSQVIGLSLHGQSDEDPEIIRKRLGNPKWLENHLKMIFWI